MRKGSIKSTQINSEVKREISHIIQYELKDPRVHPLTSVLDCEVTADLKQCKIYVSVLSDEEDIKKTMEGLKKAAPFIRKRLAETVNLRNTPELKFIHDDRISYGVYMSHLIEKVTEEDQKRHVEEDSPDGGTVMPADEETDEEMLNDEQSE